MKSPFYWTVGISVSVNYTYRASRPWFILGLEVIFISEEKYEHCMDDLNCIAQETWDIGEEIGGETGEQLTGAAIVIWDIRSDLMAMKARKEVD